MKEGAASIVQRQFGSFRRLAILVFTLFSLALAAVFTLLVVVIWRESLADRVPELIFSVLVMFGLGLTMLVFVILLERSMRERTAHSLEEEVHKLQQANNRAKSVQAMASTLSATLSLERVMEVALDVTTMALEEMGIPSRSLAGAVFLYTGNELTPVAARRFVIRDYEKRPKGEAGIVGEAMREAEPAITDNPAEDPDLLPFVAFQNCKTAISIPLRAGFQIYGAMVVGTEMDATFNKDHLELFGTIADQAVIALQNSQLYHRLEAEKQRIIAADADARRELARDLHDGPTQSIAAVAMRINFVRSLMVKNPRLAFEELKKIEELAKQTSHEIRGLLFGLRPLVMETGGLSAALEMATERLRDVNGLNVRLVGADHGDLLNDRAQGVVFSILDEAMGNARKHAQAEQIEVRLWQEADLFVACVQDNGMGFDTHGVNASYSTRGSLGMVNMRERAERIDGSLRVESRPGNGTTVTLVVPLERHGQNGWKKMVIGSP